MNTQSAPQTSKTLRSTTPTKGWLSHLKVVQKITLGYAVALGLAATGTATGIVVGNLHQQQALNRQKLVQEEVELLSQLQTSVLQSRTHQQQLIPLSEFPKDFREEYNHILEHAATIEAIWAKIEAFHENREIREHDHSLEVSEFLQTYDGVATNYLKTLDDLVQTIDPVSLNTPAQVEAAQSQLLDFTNSNLAITFDGISDDLSHLIEEARGEQTEAKASAEAAQVLRNWIITLSMGSSLAVAALLALIVSRTINQPLKALEAIALRVTQEKDFDLRATVVNADEVGTLATTLNQLIEWVGNYTQSLRTAQLDLENQADELNAIIDNLGDGLLVINSSGQITRSNPSLRKMFNLKSTRLGGQHVQDIFDAHIIELITKSQADPALSFNAELALSADRIGQARVTAIMPEAASARDDRQSTGSVLLIRDITAEKAVDQMKTDFISTVSHELRTPLTSVLGFAKLIQKKLENTVLPAVNVEGKKTERAVHQVKENLNIIVAEGERLTSLINDVLDIAKIEAGKIEWNMQPILVSEVIDRAIAATSVLAENSSLVIIREIEPNLSTVMGDRDRLIQVVINLLSNAIKFTATGSVTCRVQRQGNEVVISVIDTGVGLAPTDLDQVFEKFKQVGEVMTDKPKGTGLGLPICKQIIEHHGGRIWVDSQLGQGSTFSVTLPMKPAPKAEVTKTDLENLVQQLKVNVNRAVSTEKAGPKTILVVDDEPYIRKLLRQELEAAGYQVREAEDGMAALKQVKIAPPDLIILDVMMPNINGFDLAAVLKNNPATMDIPTIVLSIIQDQERGYRLGIDRYLNKPIDTEVLLRDIKTLLAQGASNRKVLVVDMDTSASKTLTEVLLSKGYTVTEASTGCEGIEKALSLKPDMIIVDSGISNEHDLVKTLRFDKGLENIFIIMMEHQHAAFSA